MTTVQTMQSTLMRCALAACCAVLCLQASCASNKDRLDPPDVLVAPYNAVSGDVLWAVAPLANESGVSFVDTAMVADAIVTRIDEVRGLACLPLNRTLGAMRAKGMRSITSPADARTLANLLGVDGLIVGTITSYDPYDPPKIGLKLALFARNPGVEQASLDPLKLQMSYTEFDRTLAQTYLSRPVATVSEHLDAANHDVLFELRRYATGRHDPNRPLGWKSYTMSMDLYTQFAAQVAVSRLIEQERLRVAQPVAGAENSGR